MNLNTVELFRRFENLIRLGTIAEVDYQEMRLRVKSGELLTQWLPWPAEIGRNFKHWRPLRESTQVVLCCPAGDPAQAVIVSMLYSQALPTPADNENLDLIQFEDGTRIEYHSDSSTLKIDACADVQINASGNVQIDAENSVQIRTSSAEINADNAKISAESAEIDASDLSINGASGDVTVNGISLTGHTHTFTCACPSGTATGTTVAPQTGASE